VPAERVDPVLEALRVRDIAAWVAPSRRTPGPPSDCPHDLWVASGELNDAQDVVMRTLAERR
jgi:hypothetical protein